MDYQCKLAATCPNGLELWHTLWNKTRYIYTSKNSLCLKIVNQKSSWEDESSDLLIVTEPWEKLMFEESERYLDSKDGNGNKEKTTSQFKTWLKTLNLLKTVIYADGTQETSNTGTKAEVKGCGVCHLINSWHNICSVSLGGTYEMYYAEAIALLESLKKALWSSIAWVVYRIHIYLDNLSVICNKKQIP